jgi:predicted nucleic acid-binding protein
MYVLDTNVISELRKGRTGRIAPPVKVWFEPVALSACYLSTITIQEIETGILLLEGRDPAQAAAIRRWLEQTILYDFKDRILPVDISVARVCAQLHVPVTRPYRDALIAATAMAHGMTVVTRNVKHFAEMSVRFLDPWAGSKEL